jgi:hypothetical protein
LSRLERYREIRRTRRKFVSLILLFFFLLVSGTCITDYSINNLMRDKKSIGFLAVERFDTCIEISFMNQKIYLNTVYLERDMKKLKSLAAGIFGKKQPE